MFTDTRGALRLSSIRPLKVPQPIEIKKTCEGKPNILVLNTPMKVISIEDTWKVYTRWWRTVPIDREYFDCLLETGQRIILFKDHNTGHWFKQSA